MTTIPRPPGAPSALKDISPVPSLPSDTFSERTGRETQPPNLLDRLTLYRDRARHCESPIERREWVEAAENLIDQLFDPRETCDCGMTFDNMTGLCLDCIERHEQLTAAREHAGAMALDIDTDCGF